MYYSPLSRQLHAEPKVSLWVDALVIPDKADLLPLMHSDTVREVGVRRPCAPFCSAHKLAMQQTGPVRGRTSLLLNGAA